MIILAAQLLLAAALIALILVQSKGSGLSAVFGGSGEVYRSRRGVEKLMHRGTVLLAATFMLLALASFLLAR